MKKLSLLLALVPSFLGAQSIVEPELGLVSAKYLKPTTETYEWLMDQPSGRRVIGQVTYTHGIEGDTWKVISAVKLSGSSATWADTSVVDRRSFRPLFHSSVNAQRRMELYYDEGSIGGFYESFQTKQKFVVQDVASRGLFDSNTYPFLLRWLPYKVGYQAVIPIYDVNPSQPKRESEVLVTDVKSDWYTLPSGEKKPVWVVTTVEGGAQQSSSTYYIDQKSRTCYMQEMIAGGRKMRMVRV